MRLTHHFPLVAEAKRADLFGLGVLRVPAGWAVVVVVVRGRGPSAVARLAVSACFTHQENVSQVRDVTGCQPQGLDLWQLPVSGLCGDESPQCGEGRIDAIGAVPLPCVGCVALTALGQRTYKAGGNGWWPNHPSTSTYSRFSLSSNFNVVPRGVQAKRAVVWAWALASVFIVLRHHRDLRVQVSAGSLSHHRERHCQQVLNFPNLSTLISTASCKTLEFVMHGGFSFGTKAALVCSPDSPLAQLRSGITLLCHYRPFEFSFS